MKFTESKNLLLRKLVEEDYDAYFREYIMDKEMDRLMCRSESATEEEVREAFEWLLHREKRAYAIVHKESGCVIGNLTVYDSVPPVVAEHPETAGKVGRALSFAMSRSWQRRGLMREAVTAVIDELFQNEQVDYINGGYLSFNLPSQAFHKNLGFTYLTTERFSENGVELESIENILWKP